MTAFSLSAIWDDTTAFVQREISLLLPVALATFGVGQFLWEVGMPPRVVAPVAMFAFSPMILLLFPAALLVLFGNMAISRIVLTPGTSVGEALMETLRRVPRAIGAILLIAAIMAGIMLLLTIAATLGAGVFGADPKAVTPQIILLLTIPMFVIMIRLMLLTPVLAIEGLRPAEAIRRAWKLSAAHFLRFLGLFMIMILLTVMLQLIEQVVIGSIIQLIALGSGEGELLRIAHMLIDAVLDAMLALGWAVFIAMVYRKIAAA